MTKQTQKISEFKAIFILAFAILGFLFIPTERIFIYALLVTGLVILLSSYINTNNLSISKNIFYIIMALYNVISLFFMVQYVGDRNVNGGIYQYALYPFINEGAINFSYVIWIFVLSLFILIFGLKTGRPSGEEHDRQ